MNENESRANPAGGGETPRKRREWFRGVLLEAVPGARRRRWQSLGLSAGGQIVGVVLVLVLAALHPVRSEVRVLAQQVLYEPPPPLPQRRPQPLPPPRPRPRPVEVRLHTFQPPPPPPKPKAMAARAVRPVALLAPVVQVAAPAPDLLDHVQPALRAPVVLNRFAKIAAAPAPPAPTVADLHAGSFGGPGIAAAARPSADTVARLGTFGAADSGDGAGNSSSRGHVATGGFGDAGGGAGESGVGSARHSAAPSVGGFGDESRGAPVPAATPRADVAITQVVILAKPRPQYTAEALALHLEGEVLLRVVFESDGRIDVVGVIRGLGHGLDEQAIAAAQRIRFQPATRAGVPIATDAVLRMTFQMAD